jgi:hypothetical protein
VHGDAEYEESAPAEELQHRMNLECIACRDHAGEEEAACCEPAEPAGDGGEYEGTVETRL